MAIDYGTKRTGLAVTDPLQLIATALDTVPTNVLFGYIEKYAKNEPIDAFIVGMPRHLDNKEAALAPIINQFVNRLQVLFPLLPVHTYDERFTSVMAQRSMIESGQSRKTRRNKNLLDKISATILLQSWIEKKHYQK